MWRVLCKLEMLLKDRESKNHSDLGKGVLIKKLIFDKAYDQVYEWAELFQEGRAPGTDVHSFWM